MDFSYTKQEELFLQMIREFAEKEVKPLAAEVDEEERFPCETVEKMAKIGLMGIPVPKQYGGAGGTNLMYGMAVEELSRVCATTGVILSAHTSLCVAPIMENGTEEQKQKYLPKLASGEWIGAFGLTEPNAGTDAAGQQTTAVLDGDEWVLNGSKIFITNGSYAHVFIVIAMTDKSLGTKGISAFIVEKTDPGFSIGKKEKKMGIRGSATTELIFEECRIPKDRQLGQLGKGFGSSAAASPSSRTPSSRWPTSRPRSRPPACWCAPHTTRKTTASPTPPTPPWPSSSPPRPRWRLPPRQSSSTAATATPASTPSSV